MGAWQEIVDYTVPSNTTSVTLNNFGTITKDDFVKVHMTHVSVEPSLDTMVGLTANTATSITSYHTQFLIVLGGTRFQGRQNNARFATSNPLQTSTSFGYLKISENDRLNVFTNYNHENNSEVRNGFVYATSSGATFPSGINTLTFISDITNGIGTGSRIQIYKLAAEKVADITVASNTTQVDITGLDIKKGDEYLLVSNLLATTSSNSVHNLTPNDLTTATDYHTQAIVGEGSSSGAFRANRAELTRGVGTLTNNVVYSHIKLSNIGAYTSQNYQILGQGASNITMVNNFVSSVAENITSITKLNILSSVSNGIQSTSRFTLYKLYEGGN